MNIRLAKAATFTYALIYAAVAAAPPALPIAPVRPVIDDYFGIKVIDKYRWIEDRHAPEFLAWARAQNAHARAVLASIPNRDALLKRIEALDSGGTLVRNVQVSPHNIVYEKRGPEDSVYKLYRRERIGAAEKAGPSEGPSRRRFKVPMQLARCNQYRGEYRKQSNGANQ